MTELDENIKSLEWDKRLNDVRFGSAKEEEKAAMQKSTLEILIAFFIGLLLGLVIGSIIIPLLAGLF